MKSQQMTQVQFQARQSFEELKNIEVFQGELPATNLPISRVSENRNSLQDARLNLSKYIDYRAFLLDYAANQRARNSHWSYGLWAKKLGLAGTASLTRILQGERSPGPEIVASFCMYFHFSEKEEEYFKDLVRLSRLKNDPKMSSLILEKLSKKFGNEASRRFDEKTFTTISNWYYLTIREMARVEGFQCDAGWICKQLRFKVTPNEASLALETLFELGLLARNEKNEVVVADGRLKTTDDVASDAVRKYHEQMLDHAKTSLCLTDVSEREFGAVTLSFNKSKLEEAKELIRSFQEKFSALFEKEQGEELYQLQVQLFPLTKKTAQENKKN